MKKSAINNVIYKSIICAFSTMPLNILTMLIINILVSILPIVGIIISQNIYKTIQLSLISKNALVELIFPIFLYTIYLTVMKLYTIYYKRVYIQFYSLLDFEEKIKRKLHNKCSNICLNYYENYNFYNKLWEAKVASINIFRIVESIIYFITIIISILLMGTYIIRIDFMFLYLALLSAIPALAEKITNGIALKINRSNITKYEKEEFEFRKCLKNSMYFTENRAYGEYDFIKTRWKSACSYLLKAENKKNTLVIFLKFVFNFFQTISHLGIYILCIYLLYSNKISYSIFVSVLMAALYMQTQYNELFSSAGILSEFLLMVQPYFDFIELPEQIYQPLLVDSISLKNVEYAYPNSNLKTLNNINFKIKPGEIVAIVGINGSGKSTLSKLILGLLPPSTGNIFYSNKLYDINTVAFEYDLASVMLQDFSKYEFTLNENISLFDNKNYNKLNLLKQQLWLHEIDDSKCSVLGKEFGNTDLSGGQWQRIAMARCLYKNANLYLFDEPTSAIDPLFENHFNNLLIEYANDKTMIIITHRLSISKLADRIILLSGGTIVEEGTHNSLLKSDTMYKKLWDTQTEWYK